MRETDYSFLRSFAGSFFAAIVVPARERKMHVSSTYSRKEQNKRIEIVILAIDNNTYREKFLLCYYYCTRVVMPELLLDVLDGVN